MILIITLIKYFSIQIVPQLSNEPLIRFQQEFMLQEEGSFFLLLLYIIVSIPIQELIFRGCLQGTIQHFLISPYKGLIANFTTSLIFCMTHFFISPTFAFFTLIVSLIWGAMYIHQKTLIGVTLSHTLVGIWALHVLGIEHLFGR
jgi:membrane protease YdiL (CAAX protease family)